MKNFKTKFFVALLSFIVGISAFYLSSNIHSITPNSISHTPENSLPKKELSNKIEIRFVRFMQGDFQTEVELKITNNSAENTYFHSYSKNSYPFPTLKRDGKVVPDKRFRCGTGITEQILSPGETVFFRVPESEVTYEPTQDSWQESDKPTQIGFSFEVGNKSFIRTGKKHQETFWSEEVKFPN